MTDTVKKMIPFSKTTWKKIEHYSTDMKAKGFDHPSPAALVEVLALGAIESACLEKAIEKPMNLAPEGTRAFCQTNPCPNNDGPDTASFVKLLEEKLAETQLLLQTSEQSRMVLLVDYAELKARLETDSLEDPTALEEKIQDLEEGIKRLEDEVRSKDGELERKFNEMEEAKEEAEKNEEALADKIEILEEKALEGGDLALLARWCFENGASLNQVQGALFPEGSPEGTDIINKVFTGAVPCMPNECFKWQPPAVAGGGKS